jgi:hypothetical protein
MEFLQNIPKTLLQPLEALFTKLAEFAPNIVGALFMLIIGWVIAKLFSLLLRNALKRIGVNKLSEKVGIADALERIGVNKSLCRLLGTIIFWMIMLTFVVSASDILGFERVSSTIDDFVLYLPKVLAAAIVLLIGLYVSNFVSSGIKAGTSRMNAEYGAVLSKTAYGLLVIVSVVLAISQLDVDVTLLNRIITILLLSLAFAVMLSLGLGTREISSNVMSGVYLRDLYLPGTEIKFADIEGSIVQVGSTKTLISSKKNLLHSIPNTELLNAMVTLKR